MVKVKICGVRTLEGARAAAEAGADLVGLNFVPSSRRFLLEGPLRAELRVALSAMATVGVFADAPRATIEAIQAELRLDFLQLHGDESPETCAALAGRAPIIKAVRVDADFDPDRLAPYRAHVAYFLLDGPRPGSGASFPWARLRGLDPGRPVFVAGGLTPENVTEAISALAPFGVDTASGVEVDGAIDPDRVRAFVERARRG